MDSLQKFDEVRIDYIKKSWNKASFIILYRFTVYVHWETVRNYRMGVMWIFFLEPFEERFSRDIMSKAPLQVTLYNCRSVCLSKCT